MSGHETIITPYKINKNKILNSISNQQVLKDTNGTTNSIKNKKMIHVNLLNPYSGHETR